MINPVSSSISGLMAAAKKVQVASNNIVNADSSGSLDPNSPDQPYAAQVTQDTSTAGGGVRTVSLNRNPPFVPSFEPDSPFANSEGMVAAPNVSLDEELMNMKIAEHAYKANAQALKTGLEMQNTLMDAINHKS